MDYRDGQWVYQSLWRKLRQRKVYFDENIASQKPSEFFECTRQNVFCEQNCDENEHILTEIFLHKNQEEFMTTPT